MCCVWGDVCPAQLRSLLGAGIHHLCHCAGQQDQCEHRHGLALKARKTGKEKSLQDELDSSWNLQACRASALRSCMAGGAIVKEGKLLELHIWDAGGGGGRFEDAVLVTLPVLASGSPGDVHMLPTSKKQRNK